MLLVTYHTNLESYLKLEVHTYFVNCTRFLTTQKVHENRTSYSTDLYEEESELNDFFQDDL